MLALLLLSIGCIARETVKNPYIILNKHYKAIGGLKKIKAEKTEFIEGKIVFDGLEGTYRQWGRKPLRFRSEEDFSIINQTFGDNGEFSWMVDTNGKIQIQRDEETIKRRRLTRLLENFEHLNPHSEVFTLAFDGIEKIENTDCYVVKITNSINRDIYYSYFSTLNFHLIKSVVKQPDIQIHTYFSDYRDVEGVKHPFYEETEILPREKKEIIQLSTYKVNVDINSSLFEPPENDVKDYEFLEGESAEDIPFQFIENSIFLSLIINDEEKLWLLDNGASMSIIDQDYASSLGLKSEGKIKGFGIEKIFELSFVKLPPFKIAGLQFDSQTIYSFQGLSDKFYDTDVIGILGYDFLSRFVTKIDYARQRISFYNPRTYIYNGHGNVLDAPLKNKIFNVEMTVDGKHCGKWNVDLGAFDISFHFPYAMANGFLERKGIDRVSAGLGGEHLERVLQFKTIEFGGFAVLNPLISVPFGESKGSNSGRESVGNIGNSLLRHFVVYLDYERQQVIVEKGKDFNRDFPRDKGGLQIGMTDKGASVIVFVSPDTPAEKAGFLKGDIVESISNIGVSYIPEIDTLQKLFCEKAGTEFIVNIMRNDQIKEIKLRLQDLY